VFLTEPPLQTYAAGSFEQLELVVGANADEATVFTMAAPMTSPLVLEVTLRAYAAGLGWNADELVALYDPSRYGGDPNDAWNAFIGDSSFVCPARHLADLAAPFVPTRTYFFTWTSPLVPWLGAGHGFEIPLVFGTGIQLGDDVQLSEAMVDAWVSVAEGTPTASGQPWPELGSITPDGGTWLHLDSGGPLLPTTGVRQAECDWMADQGFLQP
jgi:carboxylesterase type B